MNIKKAVIITSVALYIMLTIAFLYYDFVDFVPRRSDYLKFSTIVLSFLTTLALRKYSFDKRDANILTLAMFCTLVTDIFLVLTLSTRLYVLGMALYGQTMAVYFFRYQKPKNAIIIPFFVYIPVFLFTFGADPLISVTAFYIQILVTNLISAANAVKMGKFPKTNAILLMAGLALFVMGDITVLLRTPVLFNIRYAAKFIFIFYTPSQALLAFSSLDYSK